MSLIEPVVGRSRSRRGVAAGMRAAGRTPDVALLVLMIAITALAVATLPGFRTATNAYELLDGSAVIAVLALAETVVMLTRQIDLSVGAIMGLVAYTVGSTVGRLGGGPLNPVVGFAFAIALGGALGLVNGFLVERLRMPAIIATLATLSIYSGMQVVVTGGSQLYAYQVPHWLAGLYSDQWGPVPVFTVIAAVLVLLLAVALHRTRWGRDLYAIGSNPDAAAAAGLPTRRRTYETFVLCGALSGVAGLLYVAQYGNVDASAGSGIELTAIAAAVIGGVSLFGGSGTALGAALGTLLLSELETLLALERISIFAQQTLQGAAIVISVAIYAYLGRLGRRRRMAAPRRVAAPAADETSPPAALPAAGTGPGGDRWT